MIFCIGEMNQTTLCGQAASNKQHKNPKEWFAFLVRNGSISRNTKCVICPACLNKV